MSRHSAIPRRRPTRSRLVLESLEVRQVPSSLYPPDPCIVIAAAVPAPRADFPPSPVIPQASAGAAAAFPPEPV
jgi:hypothetical protein